MANELVVRPTLTPDTWSMIQSVALASYQSRKFNVNEGEAAIKLLFCYENGLPLTAANTGLYVVNGRLAAMANVIAAQIRQHPDYDYRIDKLDNDGCTVTILRRNPETGRLEDYAESSFTAKDAKTAGMDKKDNYQAYPRNMFFSRAISNAQRWYAPDVFNQPIYTPEELDVPVDDQSVIEGSWSEPTDINGTVTVDPVEEALTNLMAQYGPEAVVEAAGGTPPGTLEEIEAVMVALAGNEEEE